MGGGATTTGGPTPLGRSDPGPKICSFTPKICSLKPSSIYLIDGFGTFQEQDERDEIRRLVDEIRLTFDETNGGGRAWGPGARPNTRPLGRC